MRKTTSGFTIVELLIVIVVIAILATISIVAYNGIQQRANNTAIINAASSTMKLIQAYIAQEGEYPHTVASGAVYRCISNGSACQGSTGNALSGNAGLNAELAKVGAPPHDVPNVGEVGNGIIYMYHSNRMVDGASQPVGVMYWLQGLNQDCGMSGHTSRNNVLAATKTQCTVSVPGPAH